MAFRTFATFAVQGATPQPLVGSWITAGAGAPTNTPGLVLTLGAATTAGNDATNIFGTAPGHHALIIDPNGANAEDVYISAVSGNQVTLGWKPNVGLGPGGVGVVTEKPHLNGAFGVGSFIIPNIVENNMLITLEDGGTGQWLYIGNAITMTATFRRIFKLAKVAANANPFFYNATENFFGNPFPVSELFVLGTAGDQYNVAFAHV